MTVVDYDSLTAIFNYLYDDDFNVVYDDAKKDDLSILFLTLLFIVTAVYDCCHSQFTNCYFELIV